MKVQQVEVAPRSRREIRGFAQVFREISLRALRTAGSAFPIVDALELVLPGLDPDFALEIGRMRDMGEDHGLTIPSAHIIRLREDVYEGACEGLGRDRLTVAHEVGHFLMHDDHLPRFARRNVAIPLPAFRNAEWQASCFGAELLVFPDGLSADMTDRHVATLRGVSNEAAKYQMNVYRKEGLLR